MCCAVTAGGIKFLGEFPEQADGPLTAEAGNGAQPSCSGKERIES